MNIQRITILAALVLGLALFMTKVELPREEKKKQEALLLGGVTPEALAQISISTSKAPPFALINESPENKSALDKTLPNQEKDLDTAQSEHWVIKRDQTLIDAKLDPAAVNALLKEITSSKLPEPLPADDVEGDKALYGFDKPEVTLQVKTANGKETVIELGKRSEYTGERYIRKNKESALFLVADSLYSATNKEEDSFRSRSRLEFSTPELTSLTIAAGDAQTVLEQKEGHWNIVQPYRAEANQEKVAELFRQLRALSVEKFKDMPEEIPAKIQGAKSDARITLESGADATKKRVLTFFSGQGEDAPHLFFQINDTLPLYQVAGNTISHFSLKPEVIRESRLHTYPVNLIEKVEITSSLLENNSLVLLRTKDGWTVDGGEADTMFVEEYLQRIGEIEAADLTEANEINSEIDPEQLRFLITLKGRAPLSLVVSKDTEAHQGQKLFRVLRTDGEKKQSLFLTEKDLFILQPKKESLLPVKSTEKNPNG